MRFRVVVYEGFGESHSRMFKSLKTARAYQQKVWKKGGPKHFVTVEEKIPQWVKI